MNRLFTLSRNAAGSRTLVDMLRKLGHQVGRFKVRRLMKEALLISKQPGAHSYKHVTVERPDISNYQNREFDVDAPNQIWCGDITYIWAGQRWCYLAAVIDPYRRRVVEWAMSDKPGATLVTKALSMAYEQRGRPKDAKHEPSGKLLGQRTNGKAVQKSKNRMDPSDRLYIFSGSNQRYQRLHSYLGYKSPDEFEQQKIA